MQTEAKFAEVLEAVRTYVTDYPHTIEVDELMTSQIAKNLNIDLRSGSRPWEHRATEEKLTGQVRRALNKLAEAGTLVKVSDGHRVEFSTPETHARRQREHAEREAEQQAVDKRTKGKMKRTIYADRDGMISQLQVDRQQAQAIAALTYIPRYKREYWRGRAEGLEVAIKMLQDWAGEESP